MRWASFRAREQARSPAKATAIHKKPHLPTKTCATCGRPFTWRKKWERVWDEVRYCSDRCRSAKPKPGG